MQNQIANELARRGQMWASLLASGSPPGVAPSLLKQLRIYGGAQGIWVDKTTTGGVSQDGGGVTVGVLHTGSVYPDDLAPDGVIYHYSQTGRVGGRDQSEIDATKTAGRLGLPIFVITHPTPSSPIRNVTRAWVEGWDDSSKQFLISFGEHQPHLLDDTPEDDEPFELVDKTSKAPKEVVAKPRPGQSRFKFRVLKRYGPCCAVCDVSIAELLDAAHLRPKKHHGSDDPRNGLALCALHHRAFDSGFFAFEPATWQVQVMLSGPGASALQITRTSIGHLKKLPHPTAVKWY